MHMNSYLPFLAECQMIDFYKKANKKLTNCSSCVDIINLLIAWCIMLLGCVQPVDHPTYFTFNVQNCGQPLVLYIEDCSIAHDNW